jgi:hypothetical protein
MSDRTFAACVLTVFIVAVIAACAIMLINPQ